MCLLLAEKGSVPIRKLDLILHADDELLRDMLSSIDIVDPEVWDLVFSFLTARRTNDHAGYLRAVKALVNHSSSPFCLTKGSTKLTLPPPTVYGPPGAAVSQPVEKASSSIDFELFPSRF